ncbi:MAG: type VI secretion system tip protein VgrG [Deltaproteobacteria bacterium]|nr:type VI secretion system tip protein VgrG [Deltaproteobacteria bacterium]
MTAPGELFTIRSKAIPDGARVAAFRGREALSELYEFEIGILVPQGVEVDLDGTIGQRGTLAVRLDDEGAEHVWHGIFVRFEMVHAWLDRTLYRAVLVPEFWRLTARRHCVVFTGKSVPEVLRNHLNSVTPAPYEFHFQQNDTASEMIIQYRETHLAFLSRWMERRGIYYFFEQGAEEEKLHLTDHKGVHEASRRKPVRYVPASGGDSMALEALDGFVSTRSSLPKAVDVQDYNHQNPSLEVRGRAAILESDRGGTMVFRDNDRFNRPEIGDKLAQIFAESELARKCVHHGSGRVFGLRPGYLFSLEGHPHERLNREYLVTALVHEGVQAADADVRRWLGIDLTDEYRVHVTAIDSDVQYRSPRRTPWPRVHSMERAFIAGEDESEYAQIDAEGRYHVKIAFDERPQYDEFPTSGSAWVRMMQPHGGEPEGFHMPLRRKTEVLLSFVGGDPDQPVIAGVVPNALTPSPVTSANATQNVIQTGGKNRIEMEDENGKQYIDISTPPQDTRIHLGKPHDGHGSFIVFNTSGDQFVNIGGPRKIEVGGTLDEHVKGNVTWKHDSERHDTVRALVKETYGANHLTKVTGIRSEHVGGDYFRNYGANLDTIVGGSVSEDYGGSQTTTVAGSLSYTAGATKFKFADTTLNFGATHLNWGNVDGLTGSITLKTGAVHITAPSIVFDAPKLETTTPSSHIKMADWKVVGAVGAEYVGVKFSTYSFKIDAGVVSFAATGLKVEKTDIGIKSQSVEVKVGGTSFKSKSIYAALTGVWTVA